MKGAVYYHRSYKTVAGTAWPHGAALFLLAALVDAAIYLLHPEILEAVVGGAREVLVRCGIGARMVAWPFLPPFVPEVPVLDTASVFPSQRLALVEFAVSVLAVLVVPHLRRIPKVLVVYVVFLALLNSASAAFFSLVPHLFPYDIAEFSLLYLGIELGIWLLLPVLLATVLSPLPAGLPEKLLVILATVGYSMLFGSVRYAAFLLLLHELSVLHMAAVFFALGPLLDFVYVVAIYSLYVSVLAGRLKRKPEIWRWLFSS